MPAVYDPASAFSASSNTSGPWAYGSAATLTGAFVPGGAMDVSPLVDEWGAGDYLGVYHNPSSGDVAFANTIFMHPGELVLHPGSQGQYAAVRFTAPDDGYYQIDAHFASRDTSPGGTDAHVLVNGTEVTFGVGLATVDVPVVVIDDADAEPTETVTGTLAASDGYQLGNDADTLFVRDNDTTKYIWVSTGSHDWNDPSNWITGTVPTTGSDVYFDGNYSPFDCINVGDGLSTLGGLHLVNGYTGTATLANALSVGDFEEASGTLNQPISGYDLTVTGSMLWTGGILNALDSGTAVNVSGAAARIDTPDQSFVATGSTLHVLSKRVKRRRP